MPFTHGLTSNSTMSPIGMVQSQTQTLALLIGEAVLDKISQLKYMTQITF